MSERHPSTADGLESRLDRTYIPFEGDSEAEVYEGELAAVLAREATLRAQIGAGAIQNVESLVTSESRGRGTLTINYARRLIQGVETDDGTQELYGIDVVRAIELAPYFATLTNAQIKDVKDWLNQADSVDPKPAWNALGLALWGHYIHGQDTYTETAYELRITRQVSGGKQLGVAAANPNRVVTLPRLSASLSRLISALPAGEWLKKPIGVQSAMRRGWTVTESYQWAPQWSVIYGGTFTGIDA